MSCTLSSEIVLQSGEVLPGHQALTYFQPICSVKTCSIVGVEALARGTDAGGNLVLPSHLFALAADLGLSGPWEMHCRQRSVATFAETFDAHGPQLLFMNLNLAHSDGQDDAEHLLDVARRWMLPPSRIVVEVLESRFDDSQRLAEILARFRQRGFLLALDDVGAGHSNLDRVPLIRPDVLKIDRDLVRHVDSDSYKQSVFKALVFLCRRIGALVVAEGVETEPEAIMALELGADLLQGFGVCRPQSPEGLQVVRTEATIHALANHFKNEMMRKTSQRRLQHRKYNVLIDTLLCDLTCSPSADFDVILERAVQRFPGIECVYVLDDMGVQVSDTVFRPDDPLPSSCLMFRPAPRGTDHSLKEYYYMLLDSDWNKYTTEPYISMATGRLCQTISTCFRDAFRNRQYVLCVDVRTS